MNIESIINLIFKDNRDKCEYRILGIDSIHNVVNIINLDEEKMPSIIEIDDFCNQIHDGTIEILEEDNYTVTVPEEKLNEKEKEIRDSNLKIINDLLEKVNFEIGNRTKLNENMKLIAEENNLTKRTIQTYLIRYLARGRTPNALLPDYYKCGGEGKEKNLGDKKVGAPKKRDKKSGEGINVTSDIKEIFEKAVKKFYKKSNKNIRKTYEMMIDEYFTDEEGNRKPKGDLPTERQFRYWFKKNYKIEEYITSREGQKGYNLNVRPLLGNSMQDASYPTALFQIDSTKGDVSLVSRYNSDLKIGTPIIYIVIDVYSRLITGFYVGVENASWACVMMAIYNCTRNKVVFCKEHDIEIEENEWNAQELPEAILTDRGTEFTGKNIENLVNTFGIDVKNTPPYRADLKGIVERVFKDINDAFRQLVPGAIMSPNRSRGEKDPDKEACLNIEEVNRIVIQCILKHNNRFMDSYKRDTNMIEDNIEPIPTQIWEWGMSKKVGCRPKFSDKSIKLGLMPLDKARVTREGIKFKNMLYVCELAKNEEWFAKAEMYGTWTVDIAFDPRNVNKIYLIKDKGRDYEVCELNEREERYFNKTIFEIDNLFDNEKEAIELNKMHNLDINIKTNNFIEKEVKKAKKRSTGKQKKRENRKYEREANRHTEVFNLDGNAEEYINNEDIVLDNKEDNFENKNISSNSNKRINQKLKNIQIKRFKKNK